MQFRIALFLFIFIHSHHALGQTGVISQDKNLGEGTFASKTSGLNISLFEGRFEEGEELIFSMKVDRYLLGEIVAIAEKESVLLDFISYVEYTEFPIEEDIEGRIYEGWFRSPDNVFKLDMSDVNLPILQINNQQYSLNPEKVKYINDFLYVETSVITEWFGIDHEFIFRSLDLILKPRVPLPFQERLARARRNVSRFGLNLPQHPELARSYGILSPQVIDIQLNTSYSQSNNQLGLRYGIVGARDIGYLNTNLFFAGSDNDTLSDSRLTFSKVEHDGGLLGVFNATQLEFGDVQPVRQGLTRSRSRGFKFSNLDTTNTIDIEKINISGPLQVGWDAELYQNGVLIDQQTSVQTGEYSFLDVATNVGTNEFEIIKYGPQGEVETETRTKVIDSSLIDNQDFTYAVSITESDQSLFNVRDIPTELDVGYNLSSDFRKTFAGVSTGISLQSDIGGEVEQTTAGLSLNTIVADKILLSGNFTRSTNETYSSGVNVRTSLYGHTVRGSFSASGNGASDESNAKSTLSGLNIAGDFDFIGLKNLNYNTQARRLDNDGESVNSLTTRLGYRLRGFRIFNNIDYRSYGGSTLKDTELSGSLTAQSSSKNFFTRLSANYDLADGFELTAYTGQVDWAYSKLLKARFEGRYILIDDQYSAKLSLGTQADKFNIFTDLRYSSTIGWSAGVNMNFSLSAQPLIYGDIYQTQRRLTQTGSLSVRVFIDSNKNARFDIGEVLLPNVRVSAVQAVRRAYTDTLGIATLNGLSNGLLTDIEIDKSTLPDSTLTPLVEGVSIRARAGYADSLDYPVVITTEVEGMLTFIVDDELFPIARSRVVLLNRQGEIVKETTTEFDGYYVFEEVMSGEYKVGLDKTALKAKRLQSQELTWLSVDTSQQQYYIQDVTYQPIPSVNGYLSKIAEFKSVGMLDLYLKLNRQKLTSVQSSLKQLEKNGSYLLITKFSQSKDAAQKHCSEVAAFALSCEIIPHRYWFE